MRVLDGNEINDVSGGLEFLNDMAAAAGKDLAEWMNAAEDLYQGFKTRIMVANAIA